MDLGFQQLMEEPKLLLSSRPTPNLPPISPGISENTRCFLTFLPSFFHGQARRLSPKQQLNATSLCLPQCYSNSPFNFISPSIDAKK